LVMVLYIRIIIKRIW